MVGKEKREMSLVEIEIKGFVGTITLHHTAKRNALSCALVNDIISALDTFSQKNVRVAVLRAEQGVKVWSAGHNVDELPGKGKDPLSEEDPLRCLVAKIKNAVFPVIAMVEGGVFGGANEVVAACDIVIASENATFKFTPARMGVPYDKVGLTTMINAIGLRATKEMVFTARSFSSDWAERHGLVSRVVYPDHLEKEVYAEAEDIAKNAPLAISSMKCTLRGLARIELPTLTDHNVWYQRFVAYSSADYEEGKRAFYEKRDPIFKGE